MSPKRSNQQGSEDDFDRDVTEPDVNELDFEEGDGQTRFAGSNSLSEEELRDMSADELQTLAADLQIEGRTRMSREELISAISEVRGQ